MEKMSKIGPSCSGWFSLTNHDLDIIQGMTDFYSEIFHSWYFFGFHISRFPDFQPSPTAVSPDEVSDPNLSPLPTHPVINYDARSQERLLQCIAYCPPRVRGWMAPGLPIGPFKANKAKSDVFRISLRKIYRWRPHRHLGPNLSWYLS